MEEYQVNEHHLDDSKAVTNSGLSETKEINEENNQLTKIETRKEGHNKHAALSDNRKRMITEQTNENTKMKTDEFSQENEAALNDNLSNRKQSESEKESKLSNDSSVLSESIQTQIGNNTQPAATSAEILSAHIQSQSSNQLANVTTALNDSLEKQASALETRLSQTLKPERRMPSLLSLLNGGRKTRSWQRNLNVEEQHFLFLPLNENQHWSLIVICNANAVAEEQRKLMQFRRKKWELHHQEEKEKAEKRSEEEAESTDNEFEKNLKRISYSHKYRSFPVFGNERESGELNMKSILHQHQAPAPLLPLRRRRSLHAASHSTKSSNRKNENDRSAQQSVYRNLFKLRNADKPKAMPEKSPLLAPQKETKKVRLKTFLEFYAAQLADYNKLGNKRTRIRYSQRASAASEGNKDHQADPSHFLDAESIASSVPIMIGDFLDNVHLFQNKLDEYHGDIMSVKGGADKFEAESKQWFAFNNRLNAIRSLDTEKKESEKQKMISELISKEREKLKKEEEEESTNEEIKSTSQKKIDSKQSNSNAEQSKRLQQGDKDESNFLKTEPESETSGKQGQSQFSEDGKNEQQEDFMKEAENSIQNDFTSSNTETLNTKNEGTSKEDKQSQLNSQTDLSHIAPSDSISRLAGEQSSETRSILSEEEEKIAEDDERNNKELQLHELRASREGGGPSRSHSKKGNPKPNSKVGSELQSKTKAKAQAKAQAVTKVNIKSKAKAKPEIALSPVRRKTSLFSFRSSEPAKTDSVSSAARADQDSVISSSTSSSSSTTTSSDSSSTSLVTSKATNNYILRKSLTPSYIISTEKNSIFYDGKRESAEGSSQANEADS
ncbi:uncharacterized protein MONOS_15246 [Monocercomonoides exilis]|uniref:uncharacterized protein n=1 Tax=Monocercomonoides exilis TaxID=2049356 RepID=UPI003559B5DB|nr:hypothetical protein MONOS_15246 [Monocercomonoides exilis]|eukprot:MONOS_15246.1-p1 / transcript=MONOS_15246.1 / gene=MONOS_15246 / organism=Monocercomonoides_exilis_PA203 / gene_product=unspecified product / transcript_product=unspecified product / location=Mono_scaffold01178:6362-8881(-) / protein_length=839 / sequence_SO=supercontig / SO=protein_coding / is_pseudo=false